MLRSCFALLLTSKAKSYGIISNLNGTWAEQDIGLSATLTPLGCHVPLPRLATPTLQFDLGANLGLNRNTPDVVSYVGVSTRF